MSHSRSDKSKKMSTTACLLGASIVAPLELVFAHPLDGIIKKLQVHPEKISDLKTFYKVAIEPGNYYGGFKTGFLDKIFKRVYKFGGQPIVKNNLDYYLGSNFSDVFGNQKKVALDIAAGSLMGLGELCLLPLDYVKTQQQLNRNVYGNKKFLQIFYSEGFHKLYTGSAVTALRNIPGSGFLFGGSAVYFKGMGIENSRDASMIHNFAASATGSILSVVLTLPADRVKTIFQFQTQKRDGKNQELLNGRVIAKKIYEKEGISGFFKGNTVKIGTSILKLTFAFTAARKIQEAIDENLSPHDPDKPAVTLKNN